MLHRWRLLKPSVTLLPNFLRLTVIIGKCCVVSIQLYLLHKSESRFPAYSALQVVQRLCFLTLPPAILAAGEAELFHTGWLHLDAITRGLGGNVEAIFDRRWVLEMFVERVDIFENAAFAADNKIVNGNNVLTVFG